MKSRPVESSGRVITVQVAANIVESVYGGRMTPDLVAVVRNQLDPLLKRSHGLHWIVNLEGVTGFELAPSDASSGFYTWFQRRGGDRIAVVIRSSTIRMVISALSFAVGTSVRVFANRAQALDYLRSAGEPNLYWLGAHSEKSEQF